MKKKIYSIASMGYEERNNMKQPIQSPAAELREKIKEQMANHILAIQRLQLEEPENISIMLPTLDRLILDKIMEAIQSRDEELIAEMKKMKREWGSKPPKAGKENREDSSEMYQCGHFDALDSVIALIRKRQ